MNSGFTDIDPRIDYLEVQVDRDDWKDAKEALSDQPGERVCVWRRTKNHGGRWFEAAGRCDFVMFEENWDGQYKFCPKCSRRIEVKEEVE